MNIENLLLLNILARMPKSDNGGGCGCGCLVGILLIAILLVFIWENLIYFLVALFLFIVLSYLYYKTRNCDAYKNKISKEKPLKQEPTAQNDVKQTIEIKRLADYDKDYDGWREE